MFRPALGAFILFLGSVLFAAAFPAGAEAPASPLEELWWLGGTGQPAPRVGLSVSAAAASPASAPVRVECAIESKLAYSNALVELTLSDLKGVAVQRAGMELPLFEGKSHCTFVIEPGTLVAGEYRAEFVVTYTSRDKPAFFSGRVRRVSAVALDATLAEVRGKYPRLVESLAASNAAPGLNYLQVRAHIMGEALARAERARAAGDWRAYVENVDYVEKTARGVEAGLAFGASLPEILAAPTSVSLAGLRASGGDFRAQERPVFLFGRAVRPGGPGIADAARYGLNFAVTTLPARVTLAGPEGVAAFEGGYGELFAEAREANLACFVSLDPADVGSWAVERSPGLLQEGFFDFGSAAGQEVVRRHLRAALPFLNGQEMVCGVGLLEAPRFKFQGVDIHRAFINQVRTLYPDRQRLNAIWGAHMADYEDITFWGGYIDGRAVSELPKHHYSFQRPYQFDFQNFHRGLATGYLEWLQGEARSLAPNLALGYVLSDGAFAKDETTHTADRERVATLADVNACVLNASYVDPVYAMGYPDAAVNVAHMQSLDGRKPVVAMEFHVPVSEAVADGRARAFVEGLVWDTVISGADALALPEGSGIFEHPEALEGFATAALDINRLAPIVAGLQRGSAQVGILFSNTAKIFDKGEPHLESAWYAYEGTSFSGLDVRYVTEAQCEAGVLDELKVLVLPETPALNNGTFGKIDGYVEGGGVTARVGTPIPYDEHGRSRTDVIRATSRTMLVRGINLPTEYLHSMDGVLQLTDIPSRPRAINDHGYPLEGVKTRYGVVDGEHYLYIMNLRKDGIHCSLPGEMQTGRDLIRGRDVAFPLELVPLEPLLIRLDAHVHVKTLEPVAKKGKRK